MSNTNAELVDLRDFYTQDAEVINTAISWDDAIRSSGLNEEEYVYVSSPYTTLKGDEKDRLLSTPFYVRAWRFAKDADTAQEYVVLYTVLENGDMFIITDGSTGIFSQMKSVTTKRIGEGHATPVEHLMVANGLRVSEYNLTTDKGATRPAKPGEKVTGKARTYYLA
jgi:hypothetical protein